MASSESASLKRRPSEIVVEAVEAEEATTSSGTNGSIRVANCLKFTSPCLYNPSGITRYEERAHFFDFTIELNKLICRASKKDK